jgi:hypothetical protein
MESSIMVTSATGKVVADLRGKQLDPQATSLAEAAANAALIAAAPDLLEALRDIASSGCCETLGCSEDNPSCDAMIARAAIAKVEGTS